MNARERVDEFMRRPELFSMSPQQVQRALGGSQRVELDSIRHARQIAKERLAVRADSRSVQTTLNRLNPDSRW